MIVKRAIAALMATVALILGASSANAETLPQNREKTGHSLVTTSSVAAPFSLLPANCSDGGAIHVNVPYVPYTYCYSGVGSRRVDLHQVYSVESRNWTVTFLWRPPGGSWRQTGLVAGELLYTQGGDVDTISVP